MATVQAHERELSGNVLQRFLQDVKLAKADGPDADLHRGTIASHQFVQDKKTQREQLTPQASLTPVANCDERCQHTHPASAIVGGFE
ncbi:hypothetical protein, partial [Martelella mangrovi]